MEVKYVIRAICSSEEKETVGLFANVALVLWNNKNNKVWNDVAEPGRNLGLKAKQLWEEWLIVNNHQASRQHNAQQHHVVT
jgi:hypothetical protein